MHQIGNTPLIKLTKLTPGNCADIYVKYEGANPTGSMKDRMALSMIEGAERRGELKPGWRVVEYTSGKHRLEGIGLSFKPSILREDLLDEIIAVKDEDAFQTARELATREGIFGGITSGANVWVAQQRARELGPGKKIVTVIIDSGLKYLQGDLYV